MKKKVNLRLVGLDGNAFSIIGAFRGAAKKDGWSKEDIEEVTKNAMSKDYAHLLSTIAGYCKDPIGQDVDEDNEMVI